MSRPRLSGAGARRKGHQWERDVVHLLAAIFGDGVRRGLQYRDGGDAPDVVGVPGWWIECKKGRRPNPCAALRQAIAAAAKSGLRPVAICREDNAEPTAMLRLDDFLALLRGAAIAEPAGRHPGIQHQAAPDPDHRDDATTPPAESPWDPDMPADPPPAHQSEGRRASAAGGSP